LTVVRRGSGHSKPPQSCPKSRQTSSDTLGSSYRSAAVRSRYNVQTGTVPSDGKRLPGVESKGPEADNYSTVGALVTLFILLVRLGTPSAFVTNINAGSARPEPVVSARPCRIRQGLYSFLKWSSVGAFLAQQLRQLGDVGRDATGFVARGQTSRPKTKGSWRSAAKSPLGAVVCQTGP
jgi:hypothetical protein